MDSYPKAFSPKSEKCGDEAIPFDDWWCRVQANFPNVPEDVARYWLHEHWGQSPYGWLQSRKYCFNLLDWPLDQLSSIRSGWNNFAKNAGECLDHGNWLLTYPYSSTAKFMITQGCPPAAIILLDNRDGHLSRSRKVVQDHIPRSVVLIEGHCRFNLCLSLQSQGRLIRVPAWLMTKATPINND
jgi:hypothetical protein